MRSSLQQWSKVTDATKLVVAKKEEEKPEVEHQPFLNFFNIFSKGTGQ